MSFKNVVTANVDLTTINGQPYPPTVGSLPVVPDSTNAGYPLLFAPFGTPSALLGNANLAVNPFSGAITASKLGGGPVLDVLADALSINGGTSLTVIAGSSGGGAAGDVLTSDGTGKATWQPSPGGSSARTVLTAGALLTAANTAPFTTRIMTTGPDPVVSAGVVNVNIPSFYADASLVSRPATLKVSLLTFAGAVSTPFAMAVEVSRVATVTAGGGPSMSWGLAPAVMSTVTFTDTEINGIVTGLLKTASFMMPAIQGSYVISLLVPTVGAIDPGGIIDVTAELEII